MSRSVLAGLLALAALAPARAEPADVAAVDACLALVAERAKAAPAKDELDEKPGPGGRLAAAAEKAGHEAASCIGVAAAACVQKEGATTNAALIQCYGREAEAWDALLNRAYRAALARLEPDAAAGLKKSQRAWLAWRDADCALPALVFKGTMAGPMQAFCVLDHTARQALSLRGWTE